MLGDKVNPRTSAAVDEFMKQRSNPSSKKE